MTGADPSSILDRRAAHGFRALRHQPYRLLFAGQVASATGFWLAHTTLQGLVHELSNGNTVQQSLFFSAMFLPALLVAPIAGVIVDRRDRRHVLQACYLGVGVVAVTLALVEAAGNTSVGIVLVLVVPIGSFHAALGPAQAAVLANTVPTTDLPSAISLHAVVANLSRVAGPIIGAPLIAGGHFAVGIATIAVGSLVAAAAATRLTLTDQRLDTDTGPIRARVADGIRHARDRPPAVGVLVTIAVLSVFGVSHNVLVPDFTESVLGEPEGRFGWIIAAIGVGAVIGALLNGYDQRPADLRRASLYFVAYSVALIGVGLAPSFTVAIVVEGVLGMFYFLAVTQLQTIIQSVVDDEKRGRVMSLFQICWAGLVPLGTLILGTVAELANVRTAIVGSASVCLLVALWGAFSPRTSMNPRQ